MIAAAARGGRGGRPQALDTAQIRAARTMLSSGHMSATEVARQLGCSASALYRHLVDRGSSRSGKWRLIWLSASAGDVRSGIVGNRFASVTGRYGARILD
jgi:hypothetical protein